jgi:DNA-binding MarR family transcriptional regulator
MGIFKQIIELKDLTTYTVGLLQTRAYRVMKRKTDEFLKPFDISSTEWAFLGLLHEAKDGITSQRLSVLLGVEAPFITALAPKFETRKLLQYKKDLGDKRAKHIHLTEQGHEFVKKIESLLRKESKGWLGGLSVREVATYVKVLKKLGE